MDLSKLNSNEPITIEPNGPVASDLVTLRVRTETGKRTLIVKLAIGDKIGTVYSAVRPYLESKENSKKFVLKTNFPNKVFEEMDARNLKELGLAPSSALVIHVS